MEKKKFKLGLLPKLLIAIVLGIIIGQFFPVWFCRVVVTASSIFSSFLKFVIPLMIVAYVTMGIADLKSGAGKLLLITVALAYGSTLIAGSASYLVSENLFPSFMSEGALEQIAATADNSLASYISISIPPILDTLSAVVLAFVLGLCMSTLRGKTIGDTLYNGMKDFSGIIDQVLHSVIIPLLPLYVCGTFIDMTKSGKTFAILGILWKVFLVVIIMHLICIFIQFCVAGAVSHKNPLQLIKNQIPGYTTALGTQSNSCWKTASECPAPTGAPPKNPFHPPDIFGRLPGSRAPSAFPPVSGHASGVPRPEALNTKAPRPRFQNTGTSFHRNPASQSSGTSDRFPNQTDRHPP